MRWMGEAAGLPMDGLSGLLRTHCIGAAWAATLRTWLADDTPDLARTMASLDRQLRCVERLGAFGRGERGGRGEEQEAAPAAGASRP
jgi:hypothetical protein